MRPQLIRFSSGHVSPLVSTPVAPQISMWAAWPVLELGSVTTAQHVPYQGATVQYCIKTGRKKAAVFTRWTGRNCIKNLFLGYGPDEPGENRIPASPL